MPPKPLADLIRDSLSPAPVRGVPEVRLYTALPGSRLGRVAVDAPYFAWPWAGGIALARHLLDHPALVAGRRVLDLGAGSGLVGIAAALCGARVTAAEIDPAGIAAIALNAELNGARIEILPGDVLDDPPPAVDFVLAGDVFYAPHLARRVAAFLARCAEAGIPALIGDPGRTDLPLASLRAVAHYRAADPGGPEQEAAVYAFVAGQP